MNKEQNNQDLLVEQDEALGFYFDSLLLTDEVEYLDDMQKTSGTHESEPDSAPEQQQTDNPREIHSPETENNNSSQNEASVKDFLQASKMRQQRQRQQKTLTPEPLAQKTLIQEKDQPEPDLTEAEQPEPKQPEPKQPEPKQPEPKQPIHKNTDTAVNSEIRAKQPPHTITPGPVSPKPREVTVEESQAATSKKAEPVIVFTEKDSKGEIKEEVLIPRSQRLAQKNSVYNVTAKSISRSRPVKQSGQEMSVDTAKKNPPLQPRSKSVQNREFVQNRKKVHTAEQTQTQTQTQTHQAPEIQAGTTVTKEAPELDLSLFLPKIKTLSDEEIKQQLEALTQAAVSQAQVETELEELSQYEKYKQQTQQGDSEALIKNINNAPDWAIPEFQALLFAVSGLKLAVPLSELNGIVEWGDEYINELPGHASWYLGLINHLGKNVPVVDTLQQVVPKERWPAGHLEKPEFKHIILIDDGRWGLACEQVLEIITLKTEQVKWRSSRTKRRWLLGTVIEEKCALLDSSEFASMLQTGKDSLIAG